MAAALAEEAEDAREEAAGRAAAAEAESHQTRTSEAVAVARAAEAEAEAAKAKAEGAAAAAEAANTLSASKANAVKALETAEAARTAAMKKAAADHAETAAWGHEQRNQLVGQREAALSLEEQLAQASHEAATWQSDALFSSDAAEEARSAIAVSEAELGELRQKLALQAERALHLEMEKDEAQHAAEAGAEEATVFHEQLLANEAELHEAHNELALVREALLAAQREAHEAARATAEAEERESVAMEARAAAEEVAEAARAEAGAARAVAEGAMAEVEGATAEGAATREAADASVAELQQEADVAVEVSRAEAAAARAAAGQAQIEKTLLEGELKASTAACIGWKRTAESKVLEAAAAAGQGEYGDGGADGELHALVARQAAAVAQLEVELTHAEEAALMAEQDMEKERSLFVGELNSLTDVGAKAAAKCAALQKSSAALRDEVEALRAKLFDAREGLAAERDHSRTHTTELGEEIAQIQAMGLEGAKVRSIVKARWCRCVARHLLTRTTLPIPSPPLAPRRLRC